MLHQCRVLCQLLLPNERRNYRPAVSDFLAELSRLPNWERSISDVPIMQFYLSSDFIFSDGRTPSAKLSPKRRPKGTSIAALLSRRIDRFSMQLPLELFIYLVFLLVLTGGLPIPSDSNSSMVPFGIVSLAYSRRGSSLPKDRTSATESPFGWPQVWGATPANTSICRYPALWTGNLWWVMCSAVILLIALYGLLAFVMWGIMSVDLPRLMVWNRTGNERRR